MANPSRAFSSKGIKLYRGNSGSPETFTAVGEIMDMPVSAASVPKIQVTTLDSTAAEYIVGVPDYGDLTFNLNFDAADGQQMAMIADMDAGTKRNYKIILPNSQSTTNAFSAFVTKLDKTSGINKQVTASITLSITGAVTRS